MKTKLLGFLVLLLSGSIFGQGSIIRSTLISNESQNYCNGNIKGAYFDLTLTNPVLINALANQGQDQWDYVITDYDVNDFGPSQALPVTTPNNYFSCGGVEVNVKYQNINNPQIYYKGILTLKVNRPKPIHYYNQSNGGGDYFYTRNYSTLGNGSSAGLTYLGIAFNAYTQSTTGSIPIYRYFNAQYVDHFYTRTPFNRNATYGYTSEGIEFHAFSTQMPGTVPVYRYYSSSLINHFYTTNFSLYGTGGSGYTYEGIEFYAFPADANALRTSNDSNESNLKSQNTELFNDTTIAAFPNPTTGLVNITNSSKIIEQITVSNLFGEDLKFKITNDLKNEIDISNLPKGIYFIKVKSDVGEKVIKVFKE